MLAESWLIQKRQAAFSVWIFAAIGLLTACSDAPRPASTDSAMPVEQANSSDPIVSQAASASPQNDLFVLGGAAVAISAQTTLDDLRNRFGVQNVKIGLVPGVGGDDLPGVILYPGDTTRRAYVYFSDGKTLKNIMTIKITDAPTQWRSSHGISNGTRSDQLRLINGASYSFIGMNWDFGGWIDNWNNGTLSQPQFGDTQLLVRISPAFNYRGGFAYPLGDKRFDSEHPGLQQAPAIVTEIGLRIGASASHTRQTQPNDTTVSTSTP